MNSRLPLFLALLTPLFALSGCGEDPNAKYGPTITRAEALTLLNAINTQAKGNPLPAAYHATYTQPILVLILVGNHTDDITYDTTNSFYEDTLGSNSYWAFKKDNAIYTARDVTSSSNSTSTHTMSYEVHSSSSYTFSEGVNAMVKEANGGSFLTITPYPDSFLIKEAQTRGQEIATELSAFGTEGNTSASNGTSISDESYRSNGAGELFMSYKTTTTSNGSSSTTTCEYRFSSNLMVRDYEYQSWVPNEANLSYSDVTLNYPDFSKFTPSSSASSI